MLQKSQPNKNIFKYCQQKTESLTNPTKKATT